MRDTKQIPIYDPRHPANAKWRNQRTYPVPKQFALLP